MGWSKRGQRRFYYRNVRTNGRNTKQYVGAGWVAELAEAGDAARQLLLTEETTNLRSLAEAYQTVAAPLLHFAGVVELLVNSALLTNGFYRPDRGLWRKRHARKARPATAANLS